MKHYLKSIICLALAVFMLLSMGVISFAAEKTFNKSDEYPLYNADGKERGFRLREQECGSSGGQITVTFTSDIWFDGVKFDALTDASTKTINFLVYQGDNKIFEKKFTIKGNKSITMDLGKKCAPGEYKLVWAYDPDDNEDIDPSWHFILYSGDAPENCPDLKVTVVTPNTTSVAKKYPAVTLYKCTRELQPGETPDPTVPPTATPEPTPEPTEDPGHGKFLKANAYLLYDDSAIERGYRLRNNECGEDGGELTVTFTSDVWFDAVAFNTLAEKIETNLYFAIYRNNKQLYRKEFTSVGNAKYEFDLEQKFQPGKYSFVWGYDPDDNEDIDTGWFFILYSGEAPTDKPDFTVEIDSPNTTTVALPFPAVTLYKCEAGELTTEEPTAEPTAAQTTAPADNTQAPADSTPADNKTGCGSVIGIGVAIVSLGTLVLIRKKED